MAKKLKGASKQFSAQKKPRQIGCVYWDRGLHKAVFKINGDLADRSKFVGPLVGEITKHPLFKSDEGKNLPYLKEIFGVNGYKDLKGLEKKGLKRSKPERDLDEPAAKTELRKFLNRSRGVVLAIVKKANKEHKRTNGRPMPDADRSDLYENELNRLIGSRKSEMISYNLIAPPGVDMKARKKAQARERAQMKKNNKSIRGQRSEQYGFTSRLKKGYRPGTSSNVADVDYLKAGREAFKAQQRALAQAQEEAEMELDPRTGLKRPREEGNGSRYNSNSRYYDSDDE